MIVPTDKDTERASMEYAKQMHGDWNANPWDPPLNEFRAKHSATSNAFRDGARWAMVAVFRSDQRQESPTERIAQLEDWISRTVVWMGRLGRDSCSDLEHEGTELLRK
jgi:hypothetical protein